MFMIAIASVPDNDRTSPSLGSPLLRVLPSLVPDHAWYPRSCQRAHLIRSHHIPFHPISGALARAQRARRARGGVVGALEAARRAQALGREAARARRFATGDRTQGLSIRAAALLTLRVRCSVGAVVLSEKMRFAVIAVPVRWLTQCPDPHGEEYQCLLTAWHCVHCRCLSSGSPTRYCSCVPRGCSCRTCSRTAHTGHALPPHQRTLLNDDSCTVPCRCSLCSWPRRSRRTSEWSQSSRA
jgi:hypothetical protein